VGIRVTKTPKWSKYKKKLKNLNSQMALLSNDIISDIHTRTSSGLDSKFKPLKRYTTEYAKRKGTHKVTLVDTGEMLGSMNAKKTKNGLKLYFGSTDANDKAYYQNIEQKRKFFKLDKKQMKFIKRELGKFIVKTTR
jgi:hypothetical protein